MCYSLHSDLTIDGHILFSAEDINALKKGVLGSILYCGGGWLHGEGKIVYGGSEGFSGGASNIGGITYSLPRILEVLRGDGALLLSFGERLVVL